MTETRELLIEDISRTYDLQPRVAMDQATVDAYAEAMAAGDVFPAVVVFREGTDYWLADGWPRVEARIRGGHVTIEAEIHEGTRRDAIIWSAATNATHGLPRSNADKRKAVETLLQDPEWSQWSDREIARRCRVSHPLVAKLRMTRKVIADLAQYSQGQGETTKPEPKVVYCGPIEAEPVSLPAAEVGILPPRGQSQWAPGLAPTKPREGSEVDGRDVASIAHTSIDYARRYIRLANLATLKAALADELAGQKRKTLVGAIAARIRALATTSEDIRLANEAEAQRETDMALDAELGETEWEADEELGETEREAEAPRTLSYTPEMVLDVVNIARRVLGAGNAVRAEAKRQSVPVTAMVSDSLLLARYVLALAYGWDVVIHDDSSNRALAEASSADDGESDAPCGNITTPPAVVEEDPTPETDVRTTSGTESRTSEETLPEPEPVAPFPVGTFVQWDELPDCCGELMNWSANGRVAFIRTADGRGKTFPAFMLKQVPA